MLMIDLLRPKRSMYGGDDREQPGSAAACATGSRNFLQVAKE